MSNTEVSRQEPGSSHSNHLDVVSTENGVLFRQDDERTYPPEFTFVVTNTHPNSPVYYDRVTQTWWTAIADKEGGDVYARDDLYFQDMSELQLYWQPIEFKKAAVLLLPADPVSTN